MKLLRRRFLQFLAASPLLATSDLAAWAAERPGLLTDPMVWAPRTLDKLISNPKEAINVFDFEAVMQKNLPPAHFGYMASGIDDEVTLRANREGFLKYQLRPRRLVDVSKVDMSVDLLGMKFDSPIIIAPTGGHKGYHADGESGVARTICEMPIVPPAPGTLVTCTLGLQRRNSSTSCSYR